MQTLIKKLCLSLSFILLTHLTALWAAEPKKITCNQNVVDLSIQFMQHWTHSGPNWWASWAQDIVGNNTFVGAIHSQYDHIPQDPNPHLRFNKITAKYNDEYEMYQISCHYHIRNSEIFDVDSVLQMHTRVAGNVCYVSSKLAVTCN